MTKEMICVDQRYSTTRQLTHEVPVVENKPEDKFESVLFLPVGEGRQGEGGVRTQGYFKTNQAKKPLITVVTAVYNGERFLEETIQSVINQTYDNVEYIVIDGGSTDRTLDIIRKYEHAIDYWVSEKDTGIYDAWNKGVSLSRGDWISFLGADDFYIENALTLYAIQISKSDEVDFISSKIDLVAHEKVVRTIGGKWSWLQFKRNMNVAHVGSLHRRSLFCDNGLYDLGLKIIADYELLLRVGPELKAEFINNITARMRVGGVSDGGLQVFREVAQVKIRYGIRGRFLAYSEAIYSKLKWLIRKRIWY